MAKTVVGVDAKGKRAWMRKVVGLVLFIVPGCLASCGFAPLCGFRDAYVNFTAPGFKGNETLELEEFDICCPVGDTKKTEECQDESTSLDTCRVTGTGEPYCDVMNEEQKCDELSEEDMLYVFVGFEQSRRSKCCLSCSCYGDPHCQSFQNVTDSWILCDARTQIEGQENCKLTEEKCRNQRDHEDRRCQWDDSFDEGGWNVGLLGSPCRPNANSGPSWLTMYGADSFKLELRQGERGIIKEVKFTLESGEYSLDAQNCIDDDEGAWGKPIPEHWIRTKENEDAYDVIWYVTDQATDIRAKLRCTATAVIQDNGNVKYGPARVHVEDLLEPRVDYKETRLNLDGVCYTDEIEKTGSTANTEKILNGESCEPNVQSDTLIAQAICGAYIQGGQVQQCKVDFCGKYWNPNYDSADQCFDVIDKDWEQGFCRALNAGEEDRMECKTDIMDFGWESAAIKYLTKAMNGVGEVVCVNTKEELPKQLSQCQPGVALQYQAIPGDEDSWTTYLVFPESSPLCQGYIKFDAQQDLVLFTHKLRFQQCFNNFACVGADACENSSGMQAILRFERTTGPNPQPPPAPTTSPTEFPTASPTKFPTDSPTSTPTASPTGAPTLAPGLCEFQNQYLPLNETGYNPLPNMESCCPVTDTVESPIDACRFVGLEQPFCDEATEQETCDELSTEELVLQIGFEDARRTKCCHSCSAYGDPHVTSFKNITDTWILCDARDGRPGEPCRLDEQTCISQLDHENRNCQWSPDYVDSKSWIVALQGSPCTANNESGPSIINLYQADDFKVEVEQGERGIITKVYFTLSDGLDYTMTAEDCLNKDRYNTWNRPVPARWGRDDQTINNFDVLWYIDDDTTAIRAKLRCTATEYEHRNGDVEYGPARIHIEDLIEPQLNYEEVRQNVAGVCHTSVIPKTGSTKHTEKIESGQGCTPNADEDADIARAVCGAFIQAGQIPECIDDFCSTYWLPSYSSKQDCVDTFYQEDAHSHTLSWSHGFCKALTHSDEDYQECVTDITDFGWNYAARKYLMDRNDETPGAVKCAHTKEDLPMELSECQPGVSLQYQAIIGDQRSWTTYIAFPVELPPCTGSIVFNATEDRVLFTRPIRLIQCFNNYACVNNGVCETQSGMKAILTFRDAIVATLQPTSTPSFRPIANTDSPTLTPSTTPTGVPTSVQTPNGATGEEETGESDVPIPTEGDDPQGNDGATHSSSEIPGSESSACRTTTNMLLSAAVLANNLR